MLRTWYNAHMGKYAGEDRIEVVPGTHPVTKAPMPVRRSVGSRSPLTGTPMDLLAGRSTTAGVSQLAELDDPTAADLESDWEPDRLLAVTHLLVSGADLPELTVLLPTGVTPDVDAVTPASNERWTKPGGGLWTAPRCGDTESSWTRWCADNNYRPNGEPTMTLWKVEVPGDVAVARIGSRTDAADLHAAFHEDPTDMLYPMALIDYEGLADAGVAAIWLTEDAAHALGGHLLPRHRRRHRALPRRSRRVVTRGSDACAARSAPEASIAPTVALTARRPFRISVTHSARRVSGGGSCGCNW